MTWTFIQHNEYASGFIKIYHLVILYELVFCCLNAQLQYFLKMNSSRFRALHTMKNMDKGQGHYKYDMWK